MPQRGGAAGAAAAAVAAKKKKGRAPAHQNVFAFRHNPKSTKTAAILAAPIRHCCRRCHDKLVWRKTYRKYKPLTQASTCNICRQRNVTAAYHTICTKCSATSPTALALLQEWNNNGVAEATLTNENEDDENDSVEDDSEDVDGDEHDDEDEASGPSPSVTTNGARLKAEAPPKISSDTVETTAAAAASLTAPTGSYVRVCAICVKQPALPDEDESASSSDQHNTVVNADGTRRPLKLREIKSLQRQKEKAQEKPKRRRAQEDESDRGDNIDGDLDANRIDDVDEDGGEDGSRLDALENDNQADNDQFKLEDDEDDPFLKAVGGASNVLTGEAYQQMLLKTGKLNLLQPHPP